MRGLHRRLIRSQSVRQSILHLTARGRKCHQKDSLKSYLKHREKSMTNSMCSHRADHMATHNMPHAVRFYRVLGFEIVHGDDNAAFTRFRVGVRYPNLTTQPAERHWSWSDAVGYEPIVISKVTWLRTRRNS